MASIPNTVNKRIFFNCAIGLKPKISKSDIFQRCSRCRLKSYSILCRYTHQLKCKSGKWLSCDECDYETKFTRRLQNHNMTQHEQHKFLCDSCPYTASRKDKLEIHKIGRHTNENLIKWFQCDDPTCGFKSKYQSNFFKHIKNKHSTIGKKIKCTFCAFETNTNDILKCHIMAKHTSDHLVKWYKCDHCDFFSRHSWSLLRHTSLHNEKASEFQCDFCQYKTRQRQNLRDHIISRHSLGDKRYKCDKCSFSTHTNSSLQYHTKTKHIADEHITWFMCDQCGYRTKTEKNFKRHKSGHSKNLKCAECPFQTHSKRNLMYHNQVKHIANELITWFYCVLCDYKAKTKRTLERHNKMKHLENVGTI